MPSETLLSAEDLRRDFHSGGGIRRRPKEIVRAVDGVSFAVARGDALAVVGESGSGKTTLARLLVGLTLPTAGRIEFEGNTLDWATRSAQPVRRKVQMIFQDPLGSLDPRWRVRELVREPLDNFSDQSRTERDAAVREVLEQVGIDELQAVKRPMQLSGGQRQRVGIARAVVLRPDLVVCDEPVSALDVSIRGQILDLMSKLRENYGLTYIYISHDLSTVRKLCNRIMTMYLGEIVELAPTPDFFVQPFHPYAQALLSAVPTADPAAEELRQRIVLQGEVADATRVPTGCRFHPRCPLAQQICRTEKPDLREVTPGRWARCHFAPDARVEASERTFTPEPVTSR